MARHILIFLALIASASAFAKTHKESSVQRDFADIRTTIFARRDAMLEKCSEVERHGCTAAAWDFLNELKKYRVFLRDNAFTDADKKQLRQYPYLSHELRSSYPSSKFHAIESEYYDTLMDDPFYLWLLTPVLSIYEQLSKKELPIIASGFATVIKTETMTITELEQRLFLNR